MSEPQSAARDELKAAVDARRELGRDYEDAVLDSFLDRLDRQIAARVDAQVAERARPVPGSGPRKPDKEKKDDDPQLVVAAISLLAGIPISAIAAVNADVQGLIVAWAGIVGVNAANAVGRRRRS